MKKLFVISLMSVCTMAAHAQEGNWCGTDQYNQSIFDKNPELPIRMHEHLTRITSGEYGVEERDEECIIPVVVHVLHDNGEGNISLEQIQSGIDMLNEDFNRENADAEDTRDTDGAPFVSEASDMGIRFELAKIDPDGNCTNGIQRRYVGSASYNANNSAKHYGTGGLDAWNRNFYFNIWIVNSIASGGGGTTLGYAEFPYGGGSSNYGVIIRNDAYGTVGTASGDRTLSHEVGHCLGLLHTFQGGCHGGSCDSNGDYCCDTPPVSEAQWSCVTSQNTCTGVPSGDHYGFDALDQFENFMSYSPCQNMFSNDQKDIVINNLATIGFLSNLVDEAHHPLTGVGTEAVLCKAQFMSDNPQICADGSMQYFDDSYSNVTGWNWTFEGGTPSTSSEENPVVTYSEPGRYSVTLEVTDGESTVSTTVDDYVLVLSSPGITLPYSEDFEELETIPDYDRFMILDEDMEDQWAITDEAGYSGTHSAYISNRGNDNETKDELISGTFDLSGIDEDDDIIFNFKYAYKKRFAANDEWLRFYISRDCGESWVLRKNIHGDGLSEETQNSSYTPESQDEWVEVSITNIHSEYYTSGFRFKFEFENDNGNNIYLDDINMYASSMVSIDENILNNIELSVFPNPVNEQINLNLSLRENTNAEIKILNAVGQEIATVYNGHLSSGANTLSYNSSELPAGMYFIIVQTDDNTNSLPVKFIKE